MTIYGFSGEIKRREECKNCMYYRNCTNKDEYIQKGKFCPLEEDNVLKCGINRG